MLRLTPGQRNLISYLINNPRISLVRDPSRKYTMEQERVSARVVNPLLEHKYLTEISARGLWVRFRPTAHAHRRLEAQKKKPRKRGRRSQAAKPARRPRGGRLSMRWHQRHDEKIVALRRSGMSAARIARKYRVQVKTIRNILRKQDGDGFTYNPHPLVKQYNYRHYL